MERVLRTMIIVISVFGTIVCMAFGITVQKWANFLTPLAFSTRAVLLGTAGLILIYFCVRNGTRTLRGLADDRDFRLFNGLQLIVLFSLNGFAFGLLASALTLLIGLM